jgi:hypothetical protein
LPEIPTALPPACWMLLTMLLLIDPASTISTTSMVALSVTLRPSTKSDFTCSFSSMRLICGPPPCTTIGLMPHCFNSTISLAKRLARLGSTMAWPPYLTTTASSSYRCMNGSASDRMRAVSAIETCSASLSMLSPDRENSDGIAL